MADPMYRIPAAMTESRDGTLFVMDTEGFLWQLLNGRHAWERLNIEPLPDSHGDKTAKGIVFHG